MISTNALSTYQPRFHGRIPLSLLARYTEQDTTQNTAKKPSLCFSCAIPPPPHPYPSSPPALPLPQHPPLSAALDPIPQLPLGSSSTIIPESLEGQMIATWSEMVMKAGGPQPSQIKPVAEKFRGVRVTGPYVSEKKWNFRKLSSTHIPNLCEFSH